MKVEGRVVGNWVDELERFWATLASALGAKTLRLHICGVLYLDTKGKQALRKIVAATSTVIVADSPLAKQFADEVKLRNQDRKGGRGQHAKFVWI